MLFLFSDVGEQTRQPHQGRVASRHRRTSRTGGGSGLSHAMLDQFGRGITAARGVGDRRGRRRYLCHPFLVHARRCIVRSSALHGATRLHPAEPFQLARADGDYSPVETAIRQALSERS